MEANSSCLVEFRAGRCTVEGTRVTPKPGKGVFQIVEDVEAMKHVRWKDRQTGVIEEDLFIFPTDADLKKVQQVAGGRVLLLRWRDRSRNLFFWLQEPSADRDDEFISRVNEAINGPEEMESAPPEEIPAPVAAPTTTPATSSAREGVQPSAPNQITTEQLQSQLQTIFQSMAPQISAAETPSVAELLNPEIVLPILRDPAIEQSLSSLVQHLPEGDSSPEAVAELVRSPEFRQQVHMLSGALQSGHAGELLRSFGLDAEDLQSSSGMAALLQGLLRYHAETRDQGPTGDDQMDES